jgi:hypothetical protein
MRARLHTTTKNTFKILVKYLKVIIVITSSLGSRNIVKNTKGQFLSSFFYITAASVPDQNPDPELFGLPRSGYVIICTDPNPHSSISKQKNKYTFDFYLICSFMRLM